MGTNAACHHRTSDINISSYIESQALTNSTKLRYFTKDFNDE